MIYILHVGLDMVLLENELPQIETYRFNLEESVQLKYFKGFEMHFGHVLLKYYMMEYLVKQIIFTVRTLVAARSDRRFDRWVSKLKFDFLYLLQLLVLTLYNEKNL